jgi:hypothetical protein
MAIGPSVVAISSADALPFLARFTVTMTQVTIIFAIIFRFEAISYGHSYKADGNQNQAKKEFHCVFKLFLLYSWKNLNLMEKLLAHAKKTKIFVYYVFVCILTTVSYPSKDFSHKQTHTLPTSPPKKCNSLLC